MCQKSLVSFSIFAYTTVLEYNTKLPIILMTRSPGPHQFDFANQLKCITWVKLIGGFALKVATSGPHLLFYERNAITRARLTIWHSARAPRSDGKTVFGLLLYLAGRCCEITQRTRGPMQFKSGRGITLFVSVTIQCTIFQSRSSPPRQFSRTKYSKKKKLGEMPI